MNDATGCDPLEVFLAYSHEDEKLLNRFRQHLASLRREGLIADWYDREIPAGQEWEEEIEKRLEVSDIVLLLLSPSFIDSDYCYTKEMKRALERHDQGDAVVVPIIVRPVDWQGTPLGRLQAVPRDGKPVVTWSDRDRGWADAVKSIRKRIEERAASKPAVSTLNLCQQESTPDTALRSREPTNAPPADSEREEDRAATLPTGTIQDQPPRTAVVPFFRSGEGPSLHGESEMVYLVVGNFGEVAALDVQLNFIDPILDSDGEDISSNPPLSRAIAVLRPGEERQYFIDKFHDLQLSWGIRAVRGEYRVEVTVVDAVSRETHTERRVVRLDSVFPTKRSGPWTNLAGTPLPANHPDLPQDVDPHPENLTKEQEREP